MKSVILVLSIVCVNVISYSQSDLWSVTKWTFWNEAGVDNQAKNILREKEDLKNNNVKSRQKNHYSHGKKITTSQKFDDKGQIRLIEREYKTKKSTIKYEYDQSGNLINILSTNSKNETWKTKYLYDSENHLVERETINNKGEYSGFKSAYNLEGKISFQKIYNKDKDNPIKSLEYSYYEEGDKKATVYKEKGKTKHEWNYDCKPEGELINVKNKDKSTICIKEEINTDGNRVVWNQEFNEKGELTKTKTVFDKDSIALNKKVFNSSTLLTAETIFIYNQLKEPVEVERKYYDQTGKSFTLSRMRKKKFGGSKTTYYDKKGNVVKSSEYIVNNEGNTIKQENISKKRSHLFLTNYIGNLKMTEVRIYKSSTYVDEYIYTFY
jgi:YD repeat-containing protein